MSRKSKNAITINARLLAGGTLDKLADGRLMIKNEKTTKATSGHTPPGRIVCAATPGLFVRFNTKTYDHAFGVVTPQYDGQKSSEHIIGKLSDFHIETTSKGARKYRLDDVIKTAKDWRANGKPGETASSARGITLEACFAKWKLKKIGKPLRARKASHINQVRRCLDVFVADWLDRPISSIPDDEIENRAEEIATGTHVSPISGKEIGSYSDARRVLLSLSAIHNSSWRQHKSFNEFQAMLAEYPQDDGKQRALTHSEIAAIFNLDPMLARQKNGDTNPGEFDPCLWLRILAMRFQLLSGYRISEVLALRDCDIKRDDPICPHIVSGDDPDHFVRKSSRVHWLPLTPALEAIIDEAIKTRDECESMAGSGIVFCNRDGEQYAPASSSASFNRGRALLVDLDLIGKVQVPGNGKRLIVSHDLRRSFETYGEHDAKIDLETLGAFLDHGDSKLAKKVYSLPSDEQRLALLATVTPKLEAIGETIHKIAGDVS